MSVSVIFVVKEGPRGGHVVEIGISASNVHRVALHLRCVGLTLRIACSNSSWSIEARLGL